MTCVSQVKEVSNSICRFLWHLDTLRTIDLEGKPLGKHRSSHLQRNFALMLGHTVTCREVGDRDQIRSSKTTVLCVPSPPRARQ